MNDKIVNNADLIPASEAEIEKVVEAINLDDPFLSVSYGSETMAEIAKFTDNILSLTKAKDAGPVGGFLTDLMIQVKSIDAENIGKKSLLEKIPVVGSLFNSTKRTLAQFSTLSKHIDTITDKLDDSMTGLIKDIQVLEQLFEHNKTFYQDLSIYIEAGKRRLEKARETDLPRLKRKAEESGNTMVAQEVKDYAERMNRFERRLHDLQLSRAITTQTAPQIRIIQSNNQTLAEKIQTSILSTIPIWKNQIVLALSIQGQHTAALLQKEITNTTNDLLKKNAEMLQTSAIEAAQEVERSVVDIETLREVQGRLLSTIEETLQIAKDGRERRGVVEKELRTMEEDLKNRLTSLSVTAKNNNTKIVSSTPSLSE